MIYHYVIRATRKYCLFTKSDVEHKAYTACGLVLGEEDRYSTTPHIHERRGWNGVNCTRCITSEEFKNDLIAFEVGFEGVPNFWYEHIKPTRFPDE